MPVRSCRRVGTDVCACWTCCPLIGALRLHCCGLYGAEEGFLIAMGEAATGEGAYVEGEWAVKGEKGTLKDVAVAGVCNEPCRYDVACGGARAVVMSEGCTANARRRGDICGAWSPNGGGGGGGGRADRGAA